MYLYGASGHAKVIIDILEENGIAINAIFDDDLTKQELLAYRVTPFADLHDVNEPVIIAIGNNFHRKKISDKLRLQFGTAIHPRAVVSKRASLSDGSVVMAGAVINADAKVGTHCIVNTNASVDHDCVLGNFVHVAPGATLCGNVQVDEGTLVGSGAIIVPGVSIGKWCTIGAGAVVIGNVPDHSVVAGNPAKTIKSTATAYDR